MSEQAEATTKRSRPGRMALRVVISLVLLVGAMTGMSFAAVPLYRLFCATTGYGGTTMRADTAPHEVVDLVIVDLAHGFRVDFGSSKS